MIQSKTQDSKSIRQRENEQNKKLIDVFEHPYNSINKYPSIHKPEIVFNQNFIVHSSKNNQIIREDLPLYVFDQVLNLELFKNREKYHDRIKLFFTPNKPTKNGAFILFNYNTYGGVVCQSLQGIALLAYSVVTYDFDQAISILQNIKKKTVQQEVILSLIKAYQGLLNIISESQNLKNIFLERPVYKFIDRETNTEIGNTKITKILFSYGIQRDGENQKKLMSDFETLPKKQKPKVILQNLKLFHKIVQGVQIPEDLNEYYKLMLLFLKNQDNPCQSNIYLNFLLGCKLMSLPVRINFANKLLSKEQKRIFIKQQQQLFYKSTNLTDILYYPEENQDEICQICQNYIDEYGDLESVAIITNQYNSPKMNQFISLQNQVINLYEQPYESMQRSKYRTEVRQPQNNNQPFLNKVMTEEYINKQEETTPKNKEKLCYICFKNPQACEGFYVECVKCSHGGHIVHLITWFKANNVCAKIDCCCFCNS